MCTYFIVVEIAGVLELCPVLHCVSYCAIYTRAIRRCCAAVLYYIAKILWQLVFAVTKSGSKSRCYSPAARYTITATTSKETEI